MWKCGSKTGKTKKNENTWSYKPLSRSFQFERLSVFGISPLVQALSLSSGFLSKTLQLQDSISCWKSSMSPTWNVVVHHVASLCFLVLRVSFWFVLIICFQKSFILGFDHLLLKIYILFFVIWWYCHCNNRKWKSFGLSLAWGAHSKVDSKLAIASPMAPVGFTVGGPCGIRLGIPWYHRRS